MLAKTLCNFLGAINNNYSKSNRVHLILRATWILPNIIHDTSVTGDYIFYIDANKSRKSGTNQKI